RQEAQRRAHTAELLRIRVGRTRHQPIRFAHRPPRLVDAADGRVLPQRLEGRIRRGPATLLTSHAIREGDQPGLGEHPRREGVLVFRPGPLSGARGGLGAESVKGNLRHRMRAPCWSGREWSASEAASSRSLSARRWLIAATTPRAIDEPSSFAPPWAANAV